MGWTTYFHPLRKLNREKEIFLASSKMPPIIEKNITWDYPHLDDEAKRQEFIVLDLETTGLDVEKDRVLSIGWVSIKNFQIDLSTAKELMINNDTDVRPETVVINHITPEMLQEGVSLDDAFSLFFAQSQGKVIVAHACCVEKSFIDRYAREHFDLPPLPLLWIDTLGIEKYLSRAIDHNQDADLRLSSIRARYVLPEYNAHGALIDSISTAELLLAQIKRVYRDTKSCFGHLYRISHTK